MAKIQNPTKVITGVNTRWSYANVWDAKSINGGAPKYSVSLIIPVLQVHYTSVSQAHLCISISLVQTKRDLPEVLPSAEKTPDKSRHLKPSHGHAPMLLTSLHGSRPENCRSTALTTPLLPIMLSRTWETVKILFSGVFMFL